LLYGLGGIEASVQLSKHVLNTPFLLQVGERHFRTAGIPVSPLCFVDDGVGPSAGWARSQNNKGHAPMPSVAWIDSFLIHYVPVDSNVGVLVKKKRHEQPPMAFRRK
jgi:hypothetical protein